LGPDPVSTRFVAQLLGNKRKAILPTLIVHMATSMPIPKRQDIAYEFIVFVINHSMLNSSMETIRRWILNFISVDYSHRFCFVLASSILAYLFLCFFSDNLQVTSLPHNLHFAQT
jgi:hypothetical protein